MNQPVRRSMSVALQTVELPPEAIAIIKEGSAKPLTKALSAVPPQPETDIQPVESTGAIIELEESAVAERPHAAKARPPREKLEPLPASSSIVSMTVRVPVELPNALLRVSVERKLQRQKPFTQQEMVATAVREWLRRNGYSESGTEL